MTLVVRLGQTSDDALASQVGESSDLLFNRTERCALMLRLNSEELAATRAERAELVAQFRKIPPDPTAGTILGGGGTGVGAGLVIAAFSNPVTAVIAGVLTANFVIGSIEYSREKTHRIACQGIGKTLVSIALKRAKRLALKLEQVRNRLAKLTAENLSLERQYPHMDQEPRVCAFWGKDCCLGWLDRRSWMRLPKIPSDAVTTFLSNLRELEELEEVQKHFLNVHERYSSRFEVLIGRGVTAMIDKWTFRVWRSGSSGSTLNISRGRTE